MSLVLSISIWVLVAVVLLIIGYLLLIMPRTSSKKYTKPFLQWMYAHRGLHDNQTDAPENSLKAFAKAVEAGFGMELDVQLSKDKVPVVFLSLPHSRESLTNEDISVYNDTLSEYVEEYVIIPMTS